MVRQAGSSIASIAALKALLSTELTDGYLRYVRSKDKWYRWNSVLTTSGNEDTIVEANDAPPVGRWVVSHPLPNSRVTVTTTTASITNNAIANLDLNFASLFSTMLVASSVASRVRLYSTNAARASDTGRGELTAPLTDSGLILDLSITEDDLSVVLSAVPGGNMDTPVSDIIYAAITNKSGGPASVSLSFVIERMAIAGTSSTARRSVVEKIFLLNNL